MVKKKKKKRTHNIVLCCEINKNIEVTCCLVALCRCSVSVSDCGDTNPPQTLMFSSHNYLDVHVMVLQHVCHGPERGGGRLITRAFLLKFRSLKTQSYLLLFKPRTQNLGHVIQVLNYFVLSFKLSLNQNELINLRSEFELKVLKIWYPNMLVEKYLLAEY